MSATYIPPSGGSMSGAAIVAAIDTELGSATWQGGSGASQVYVNKTATGYSGGGATDIHATTTATKAAGDLVFAPLMPAGEREWVVVAGTDAESVEDGVIRPADYAATTNEKVLKLF